jgi:hypothetical protein
VDTFAVLPAPVLLRHFTATLTIDVTGTSAAEGRCYFLVLLASGLDHWGRYVDTYTRADGVWRFAWRRVVVEGYVPGGWSAEREAHAPGAG